MFCLRGLQHRVRPAARALRFQSCCGASPKLASGAYGRRRQLLSGFPLLSLGSLPLSSGFPFAFPFRLDMPLLPPLLNSSYVFLEAHTA